MNHSTFKALIIVLSIHIFSVHTKLLYYLNPEVTEKVGFSFLNMSEPSILSMVFAISYSLATALVIYLTQKKWLILIYAAADGLAVLLYYFTDIPMWISAFYFALYTFFLIASITFLQEPQTIEMKMFGLKAAGYSQKDIARQLNVSESKVSRTLKGEE